MSPFIFLNVGNMMNIYNKILNFLKAIPKKTEAFVRKLKPLAQKLKAIPDFLKQKKKALDLKFFELKQKFEPKPKWESAGGFHVDKAFVYSNQTNTPEEEPTPEKRNLSKDIIEWLEILTTAVIIVVLLFSLVLRVATIDGNSMKNTLQGADPVTGQIGDKVIISNLNYTPKQGDIVVISRNVANSVESQASASSPIIKRVIAVGGQTVDIDFKKGIVYVDGVALKEDYISSPTTDKYDVEFPIYVPEGYIFVLGDNRGDSLDSRSARIGEGGLIDTRYVLGHAVYRIFPFDKIGGLTDK